MILRVVTALLVANITFMTEYNPLHLQATSFDPIRQFLTCDQWLKSSRMRPIDLW
jgi:hypothetical protein